MDVNRANNPNGFASMLLLLCLSSALAAQRGEVLSGTVADAATGEPMPMVLVYVTPDTGYSYLAFAQSDEQGKFRLTLPEGYEKLLLHTRYLGYAPLKYTLEVPFVLEWRLQMYAQANMLEAVVVRESHRPIVQQSDTTRYDVKQFTDATEYSVEDVLKKLPGIEVKADGQLAVNGRPVEKVLIEHADMFGRKYVLGTKNIRAAYLDKVEIIDHYQDNPVLRHLNTSDAVVINLTLRADKKTLINGTVDAGAGAGADATAKGALHANLFSVSKKVKAIFLTSNGNTGMVNDMEEIESTYQQAAETDIKTSAYEAPEFQRRSAIYNPGLPAPFVDASRRYFSTLRTVFQPNSRWDANINITDYIHRGQQVAHTQQAFLLDQDAYRIDTRQQLGIRDHFREADCHIRYVSPDKNRNLQFFTGIGRSQYHHQADIELLRQQDVTAFTNVEQEFPSEQTATLHYSHKVGSKAALQWMLRTTHYETGQQLRTSNLDLLNYLVMDTATTSVRQQLAWRHRVSSASVKYTRSMKGVLLEVEPFTHFEASEFGNTIWLSDGRGHAFPHPQTDGQQRQSISRQSAGGWLRLVGNLSDATQWRIQLRGAAVHVDANDALRNLLPSASARLALSKRFRQDSEARFSYAYHAIPPANAYWLTTPYITDAYNLIEPVRQAANESGHNIGLQYSAREAFRMHAWSVSAQYRFGQRHWTFSDQFYGALSVSVPFFSRMNTELSANGHWAKFIPPLKANVRVLGSASQSVGQYAADDTTFDLAILQVRLGGDIAVALSRRFRCRVEGHLAQQQTTAPNVSGAFAGTAYTIRSALTLMYGYGRWQASSSWNYTATTGNSGQSARLNGLEARAQYRLTKGDAPHTLGIRMVNFPNIKDYAHMQHNAYYAFRSAVPAVPAFVIVNVDFVF